MMKRFLLLFSLITLLISGVSAQRNTAQIDKAIQTYADVLRQLDMSYADTLNYKDLLETSINQMLRKLDPYTVYIPADQTNDLRFMTTGKYGGIGALIMQRTVDKELAVYISNPYEGKPAANADLRAGDKILEIDGKKAIGKTSSEVSKMLRGTPGSTITVKVERYGEKKPIERTFKREEIKMNPVTYAAILNQEARIKNQEARIKKQDSIDAVAYIAFSDFTEGSARIFTDTLDALVQQGATSLILDLRGNGGGIIDEAVKMLANFLPKGTEVVSTKGRTNFSKRTYRTPFAPKYPDMKIIVLVDNQSASSAEIVAGALQDLDRATIIGTRTFGKGLVQNIRPIAHKANLKLTTAKYYIPSGRCIQAIKYNHDGSAERVADSLTHEFKTKQGRLVRDGGGITPDIEIKDSSKVNICYSLYMQNMFFDYATRYRAQHESIAPAATFTVSDTILTDFIQFLKEKDFTYKTETSKYFADMLEMARHEDLDSTTLQQLETLQGQLNPSFETAIWKQQEAVKEMLGNELVSRYYFQRGAHEYGLRSDKVLKEALQH